VHRSVDDHKIGCVIAMKDTDVFPTMGLCNNAASTICAIVHIWLHRSKLRPKRRGSSDSRHNCFDLSIYPAAANVLIATKTHQLWRLSTWCVTCPTKSIMPRGSHYIRFRVVRRRGDVSVNSDPATRSADLRYSPYLGR